MTYKKEIKKKAYEIKNEAVEWRRYIHMNPELSSQEYKTARFIAEKLREFGVDEVLEGFAGTTAVIGLIKGKSDYTIALRADMDALPVQEKTEKIYSSKVEGVMHSCGHDVHVSVLLGTAKLLVSMKDKLKGNVKLIFQPCEERTDCDGAKKLVENNVLKNPDVSAIFGLHVFPDISVGKVATRIGKMMAAADVFHIKIKGKGTHASKPHMGVDTIVIAAQAINSLHHIVSRKIDPLRNAVLTIGKIHGGNAENVIPEEVFMSGTVRTLGHDLRKEMPQIIDNILKGITMSYGGTYSFDYQFGTSPVINDTETTLFAINAIKKLLGEKNYTELEVPSMGGEDFGEYLEKVPGTFIRLGVRNENKGIVNPLHSPYFDIDEDAITIGISTLSYISADWLNTFCQK